MWGRDPSPLGGPPQLTPACYEPRTGWGARPFCVSALLPVSTWLLLYVLSYMNSVQLGLGRLFRSLAVIFVWSREGASTVFTRSAVFTCSAVFTRSVVLPVFNLGFFHLYSSVNYFSYYVFIWF